MKEFRVRTGPDVDIVADAETPVAAFGVALDLEDPQALGSVVSIREKGSRTRYFSTAQLLRELDLLA